MLTFSKTSHGPQKSMTTAPLEIRNATGMLPSDGGRSGLGSTAAAASGTPGVRAEFALIATTLTAASGIAAVTLIAAEFRNSSRLFIVRSVRVQCTSWRESCGTASLAAMPIIAQFLPRTRRPLPPPSVILAGMSLSPVACGIDDAHRLSRRQALGAAHHQPVTGCECPVDLHRVLNADARYHVELLHGIGPRDTQHVRMILPNHQRVARHRDGGTLGGRGQAHFDRSTHEPLGIRKRDAHLELARAIIADRNDRSNRPGLLDPVLAPRDCRSGVDIGGQVKSWGRARLGISRVDEPHGRGADLHVLASLDEALGHDPGKRRPNHRLTDLVLRLPQLRIRSRDVIGRHVALRARILELTGAQRLGGRESIEALQLRAGHLMLGPRALDLRVQVLGAQPRNRVIEPGNRISLSHTCTDFGNPHHPTADHARNTRVGAAHDRAWYPAADRHGTHADRPDLDHHAFRGSLRGARGLHRHQRGPGRDGQQRNPRQSACALGCGRTHGGTKDAGAGTRAVAARLRARSSRISAGISTRLNTRLMTTPPMLTAARPR